MKPECGWTGGSKCISPAWDSAPCKSCCALAKCVLMVDAPNLKPGSSWAKRAGGGDFGKPLDNPKESELLAKALADSGDARAKDYTDLGQQMIDDAIIVPIVNPQLVLAAASDIAGMHYSACCNLDLGLLGLAG